MEFPVADQLTGVALSVVAKTQKFDAPLGAGRGPSRSKSVELLFQYLLSNSR